MIVFPDDEALAITYLRTWLAEAGQAQPVGTKRPNPRPDRFITIYSNGGSDASIINTNAQLVIQCSDVVEVRAKDTARLVAAIMTAAPGQRIDGYPYVQRAKKIGGPTRLDDPEVPGMARYQVVISWLIRAAH